MSKQVAIKTIYVVPGNSGEGGGRRGGAGVDADVDVGAASASASEVSGADVPDTGVARADVSGVDISGASYPIYIGGGLLARATELIPLPLEGRKVFILYDENVSGAMEGLRGALAPVAAHVETLALEGGEESKSYAYLQRILDWLLSRRVERSSLLVVMGGGVVGDVGGFAASIVLRGIPFVQVPTTLLAQVDSSVGGKTGINTAQGKNLVGAFYQPVAVLCDTDVLASLPEREMRAGYAEIVKYGLLGDADFYEWLEGNGAAVLAREEAPLIEAIERSCAAKAAIVGGDEREREGGRRALLNLGHSFAHALEAAAGYDGRLLHGEAVAIGMMLAFRLCVKMGLCAGQDAVRVERHLQGLGLKTEIAQIKPALSDTAKEIAAMMAGDKKASGGKVAFILVRGIGEAFQSRDVEMDDVIAVIAASQAGQAGE